MDYLSEVLWGLDISYATLRLLHCKIAFVCLEPCLIMIIIIINIILITVLEWKSKSNIYKPAVDQHY